MPEKTGEQDIKTRPDQAAPGTFIYVYIYIYMYYAYIYIYITMMIILLLIIMMIIMIIEGTPRVGGRKPLRRR